MVRVHDRVWNLILQGTKLHWNKYSDNIRRFKVEMKNSKHIKLILEKLKVQKTETGNLKYLQLILLLNRKELLKKKGISN